MKHPTGPALGPIWVMVRKRGFENDPLGPALEALIMELEAAVKNCASDEPADAERRARALAALAKAFETLAQLLRLRQTQKEGDPSDRSPSDAAGLRDADVWREIEGRLARLRAAETTTADRQAVGAFEAGAPPR